MSATRRYDAIVVGARCAGAATAMLMARKGMRVLVLDRGAYGTDTLSTHALMRGGVLQLARWGVLPRILAAGTPAVRRTSFHYGAEEIAIDLRAGAGVDALYAPRRSVLDAALVDAAIEAGAEIRHGEIVFALDRRGERVTGVVALDAEGNRQEIAADLVVGADGIGSAVARLAEAPMLREARHATATVFGYWSGIGTEGYHWHYVPGASAGAIPTNAGLHCVFVSVPPSTWRARFRGAPGPAFAETLREVAPALAARTEQGVRAGALSVFAGRRGFLRQPWGLGWALVGDAGYFKDPITAHGMTDALRDAEALAEAAARGTPAAFADYAATRDALSLPLFEATDAIAAFDWDLPGVQALHKALNQAMKREVEHMLGARGPALREAA
ncbi:NAD(P)/FAD-dependent oxidoreductase [Falsiroseomonas bella]|uniref:NAD(P)/FAD-dependent oxidoreductase n=1 Tax=Falsiroseomonas bella TaxID=2184016 RepID=A0A317FC97_9PROT|nr:NAD(P)/FAD-dependent oxidoreductase [Falsiroseomonas bella]PWS35637.1 NAD(P)/FAD-dependent oxidoreductase [Falsiroseomonas bella]